MEWYCSSGFSPLPSGAEKARVPALDTSESNLAAALRAGKARQFQRLFTRGGNLVEQRTQLNQRGAHGMGKGTLQPLAQGQPIRLALQQKAVHPAVAVLKHFDQQVFHLLPAVVAPEQQSLDRPALSGEPVWSILLRVSRAARR